MGRGACGLCGGGGGREPGCTGRAVPGPYSPFQAPSAVPLCAGFAQEQLWQSAKDSTSSDALGGSNGLAREFGGFVSLRSRERTGAASTKFFRGANPWTSFPAPFRPIPAAAFVSIASARAANLSVLTAHELALPCSR